LAFSHTIDGMPWIVASFLRLWLANSGPLCWSMAHIAAYWAWPLIRRKT